MKIKFWGVRGSIPTPITTSRLISKIQAVVQRITENDIATQDSRERFIATLPKWISETVGGNSACVELRPNDKSVFILDCGSGLRPLGKELAKEKITKFHIFLSHFHWDHIQGLPFFDPIFNPNAEIHFYSPKPYMREVLFEKQIIPPMFPIDFEKGCTKNLFFHQIEEGKEFQIDNCRINTKKMFHPNDSYAYSFINEEGKKFIYATDAELRTEDYEIKDDNKAFFENTDVLVLDSQYTLEEAVQKQNWGHSAFCYAVDFAALWNTKKLFLYHHEPLYDDKKIYAILDSAKYYAKYTVKYPLDVELAVEEVSVEI